MKRWNKLTLVTIFVLLGETKQLGLNTVTSLLDIQLNEVVSSLQSMNFERIGSNLDSDTIESIIDNFEVDNEEKFMSGFELLTKYNYCFEEYTVITGDGYVLKLVRLPRNGPPVLVVHGLVFSFEDFITPGPGTGLAYLLFDAGYDVWMINCRGNTFSRQHVSKSPEEREFWDFTWHEIGTLDLPVTIDFILEKTGQTQLIYIGHSQGTTSVLVLLSEVPEYNLKLKLVILLSPVAFMSKLESPVARALVPLRDVEYFILNALGQYEFQPSNEFTRAVRLVMCPTNLVTNYVCSNYLFLLFGFDFAQINITHFPIEYFHVPSGAATKQVIHYLQEVASERFEQFDYGTSGNLERYNSRTPPQYNLSQVTAPVALYYASNDWLSNVENVQTLARSLPNVVENYLVPFEKFNHIDFLWAKDVVSLLYSRVFRLMTEFN